MGGNNTASQTDLQRNRRDINAPASLRQWPWPKRKSSTGARRTLSIITTCFFCFQILGRKTGYCKGYVGPILPVCHLEGENPNDWKCWRQDKTKNTTEREPDPIVGGPTWRANGSPMELQMLSVEMRCPTTGPRSIANPNCCQQVLWTNALARIRIVNHARQTHAYLHQWLAAPLGGNDMDNDTSNMQGRSTRKDNHSAAGALPSSVGIKWAWR